MKYDVRLKHKLSLMIIDKRKELLEYNFKEMYLDVFYHGEVFKQPVTIHNATQYMKDLGIELKVQIKENLTQTRIDLLDQVLGERLSSQEFKDLTEKLNFRRDGRMLKNPIDEIKQLGYEVINKKSNSIRYKIITKTTIDFCQVS